MDETWLRIDNDGGVIVDVWVVPGASHTGVAGVYGDALRVRVTDPPEGGKANQAVERLLAGLTGGGAAIVRGASSRRKTVEIRGVAPATVASALRPPT